MSTKHVSSPSAPAPRGTCADAIGVAAKVAFLKRPASYPDSPRAVEALETHLAWVFLTDRHAYKLKKPVRYPFLDFTTLAARRSDAEEEVRLNRRLAPAIYLEVVALTADREGRLGIGGEGTAVDWLVKMRRLPRERMLDHAIAAQSVDGAALRAVAELLAAFYRDAQRIPLAPAAYRRRLREQIEGNVRALAEPRYGLPAEAIARTAAAQLAFLERRPELLEARAREGRIVDGHGDLRPEHVALGPPPAIIDCVEFNRDFRILDPVDELAYLAMESERLGAPSVGATLLAHYGAQAGDRAPEPLIHFYKSVRAALRAKLAAWHLDDPTVRYPSQWFNRTQAYLALADLHIREA
jgi:aminoglycoside phosphotransferase family enzyme